MRSEGISQVMVTGDAGFLGSHLCERLLPDDYELQCIDDFYTGTKQEATRLTSNPDFEKLRHDITFPLYIDVVDICSLACPASPIQHQFDFVQTTNTSVPGAIKVLGLANRVKTKNLQSSNSEVYGNPEARPQRDDYWAASPPANGALIRSFWNVDDLIEEFVMLQHSRTHFCNRKPLVRHTI